MEIELEYRDERALLSAGSGVVRVQTSGGRVASRPATEPVRLIDRTPVSVRLRDDAGRVFGLRLTPGGAELTGDGFAGAALAAPSTA